MVGVPQPDRSQQKLVSVYSAANEMEARMMQEVLANAGIESAINAEFAPGIYPASLGQWARQEILVIESAAEEARRILSELPGPAPNPTDDPPQQ
jgi:hypothetical protein